MTTSTTSLLLSPNLISLVRVTIRKQSHAYNKLINMELMKEASAFFCNLLCVMCVCIRIHLLMISLSLIHTYMNIHLFIFIYTLLLHTYTHTHTHTVLTDSDEKLMQPPPQIDDEQLRIAQSQSVVIQSYLKVKQQQQETHIPAYLSRIRSLSHTQLYHILTHTLTQMHILTHTHTRTLLARAHSRTIQQPIPDLRTQPKSRVEEYETPEHAMKIRERERETHTERKGEQEREEPQTVKKQNAMPPLVRMDPMTPNKHTRKCQYRDGTPDDNRGK